MKIDRLLSIIMLILKKKKVTASELAAYFETSLRTIYRDMDSLCLAGFPIVSEAGVNGGYSLMDGFTMDKQVFKADEILAIIAGLKGLEGVFEDKSLKKAVEKVESLGSEEGSLPLEIDFFGWGEGNRLRHSVRTLYGSISEKRCIRFEYTNLNNKRMERIVEPLKLFFRGSNWYLLGYCRSREDYRFFRVSRMLSLSVLDEIYQERENALPDWTPDVNLTDERPFERIHIRIAPGAAARAREYFDESNIRQRADGSLDIEVAYPRDEWVYSYLLSYGEHIEVLSPAGLRRELQRRAENFLIKNRSLTD